MAEIVRVGIIGAGKIAQDRHIPLLQKVPDVRITQAWSRTPETARKAARQFGIPQQVERWDQIVESPEIDAVVEFCEAVAQSIHEGRRVSMLPEPRMDSWGRPL